jgi:hypothetical protein
MTSRTPALTAAILNLDTAHCPCCERRVDGPALIQEVFGFRVMNAQKGRIRVQSYCRKCRSLKAKQARRARAETQAICEWLNALNG